MNEGVNAVVLKIEKNGLNRKSQFQIIKHCEINVLKAIFKNNRRAHDFKTGK